MNADLDLLWNRFFLKFGELEDPNMKVFGCQGGDYERIMSSTRKKLKNPYFPNIFSILLKAQGLQVGRKNQFKIGGDEPPENVCWVPNATWGDFKSQVLELLEAGYPGCVGCGGPGAEGEWNEQARRIKMQSNY